MQDTGQPTATVPGAKGEGMGMGVHKTSPNTINQKTSSKKKKSPPSTVYYPLQQEMLIKIV